MSAEVILKTPTPPAWFAKAAEELEVLILDHANCEKKAASTALGLIFAYSEDEPMCLILSRLAREELRHFEQVSRFMTAQGIAHRRLSPSRYASELRKLVAVEEPLRKLDLLIMGSIVEARSAERFDGLIHVVPKPVAEFYQTLSEAERRHIGVYETQAERTASLLGVDWRARLEALLVREAEIISAPDPQFRFHSGCPA